MSNHWRNLVETVKDYSAGKFNSEDYKESLRADGIDILVERLQSEANNNISDYRDISKIMLKVIRQGGKYEYSTSFMTEKGFDRLLKSEPVQNYLNSFSKEAIAKQVNYKRKHVQEENLTGYNEEIKDMVFKIESKSISSVGDRLLALGGKFDGLEEKKILSDYLSLKRGEETDMSSNIEDGNYILIVGDGQPLRIPSEDLDAYISRGYWDFQKDDSKLKELVGSD
jgi:hypothetical protein